MKPPKFRDALAVLCRHQVDFIVVGGVAAVLNGAPISTFDLDIVHSRQPDNLLRLLAALTELQGPVDVLGEIGNGHAYEELLGETVELQLGGTGVRVLGLAALIRIKEEVGHAKDVAVLAILRRTLRESEQK